MFGMMKDSCIFHLISYRTEYDSYRNFSLFVIPKQNSVWFVTESENVAVIYILFVINIMTVVIDFIYLVSERNLIFKYSHIIGYDDRMIFVFP